MLMLHMFVLVFFSLLLLYYIVFGNDNLIEGMDNDSASGSANASNASGNDSNDNLIEGMDNDDPLTASKITASDIIVIKKQLGEITNVDSKVTSIENQISQNTTDIIGLGEKSREMKAKMMEKQKESVKKKDNKA
jgi:hypothetical protein